MLRRRPFVVPVTLALIPGMALALAGTACSRGPVAPVRVVEKDGTRPVAGPLALGQTKDPVFDGRVRLVEAIVEEEARPGEPVPIQLGFVVERDCSGRDPVVFVHAQAPGSELNQAQADHKPVGGRVSATEWRTGDLLIDTFELRLPAGLNVDALDIYVGLYEGKERWPVTPSAAHDGKDRVRVGRVRVEGGAPVDVKADVPRRKEPIAIDGALTETEWQRAARLGPFVAYDGKSPIERATTARMLWDDEHLFVAFEGEDPDVFTPYTKNDDPLYDSEAIEVFIDADGDQDVYVELQAAPANDLHFDAAFAGGRRKNMDRAWNAPVETKTTVTTSGFVSEWKIPVRALKDIPAGEPRAGATWRVNLFRLERVRRVDRDGGDKVTKTEASAWSSPLSGDFHNLARFGVLTFVE